MSESIKRNSTREKKPPRYLQTEEAQFGIYSGAKVGESKELRTSSQEINQVAKLFIRFANNVNQKLRDHIIDHPQDSRISYPNQTQDQNFDRPHKIRDSKNSSNNHEKPSPAPKKTKDQQERAAYDALKNVAKGEGVKKATGNKSITAGNPAIQSDLNYHALLNDHIKQSYPDVCQLSPEMLMQLGIPKQLFGNVSATGQVAKNQREKDKEKERKKNEIAQMKLPQKEMKEDLKPFKRQSYHVAIAYHIHLKHVRNSGNSNQIDPTYNARKLREQANEVRKQTDSKNKSKRGPNQHQ